MSKHTHITPHRQSHLPAAFRNLGAGPAGISCQTASGSINAEVRMQEVLLYLPRSYACRDAYCYIIVRESRGVKREKVGKRLALGCQVPELELNNFEGDESLTS